MLLSNIQGAASGASSKASQAKTQASFFKRMWDGLSNFVVNNWGIIQIVLMVAAALLVLYLLYRLIRWIRSRRGGGADEASRITKKTLLRLWQAFIKHLPPKVRRPIGRYPTFVVMGDAASGKTALVTRYTDWEGQARQFYPSYTADPRLQAYLGTRVLVQELPATVLNDTSRGVRRALLTLWRRVFKRQDPTAVIAIRAGAITRGSPEALKRQAQMLRGKLNLLSELKGRPVTTKIVLTHMGQLEGFDAFSRFLGGQGIPLTVELGPDKELATSLEPFEELIPMMLTSMPADQFQKILSFMQRAPELLMGLDRFLKILGEPQRLSITPNLAQLFLVSNQPLTGGLEAEGEDEGNRWGGPARWGGAGTQMWGGTVRWGATGFSVDARGSGPFEVSRDDDDEEEIPKSRRRHKVAALLLTLLGLGYLATGFFYERDKLQDAEVAMVTFEERLDEAKKDPAYGGPTTYTDEDLRQYKLNQTLPLGPELATYETTGALPVSEEFRNRLRAFTQREERDDVLPWFPSFFEHEEDPLQERFTRLNSQFELLARQQLEQAKERIAEAVEVHRRAHLANLRRTALIPALERAIDSKTPHERSLYALALIYASRDSQLGKLVLKNKRKWSEKLEVPEPIITEYVAFSYQAWEGTVDLSRVPDVGELPSGTNEQAWLVLFGELDRALTLEYLTPGQLEDLQANDAEMLRGIYNTQDYGDAREVYELLVAETQLSAKAVYGPYLNRLEVPDWISKYREELDDFLLAVRKPDLIIPDVSKMGLRLFLMNLAIMQHEELPSREQFTFTLAGRTFRFDTDKWFELIRRSRIRRFALHFIDFHKKHKEKQLFFGERQVYDDIVRNALFTGRPNADVTRNSTNDGTFLFIGKATVKGWYTKEAYDGEVLPALLSMEKVLEDLKVERTVKTELRAFVQGAVQKYAGEYRWQWFFYFQSFDVEAKSLGGIKIILRQLQLLDGSPLLEVLETIQDNTALDTQDLQILEPMRATLAEFDRLNQLRREVQGRTELMRYQDVLAQIDLDLGEGQARNPEEETGQEEEAEAAQEEPPLPDRFLDRLSPVGRMAYDMLLKSKNSYELAVNRWLESVGLTGGWRKPFQGVIREIYKLGLAEIEEVVAQAWADDLRPELDLVLTRFPFNPKSETRVTQRELEDLLLGYGVFWKGFRRLIAPVLIENSGVYRARVPSLRAMKLPEGMLGIINKLSHLTRTLWDKEGTPQPIRVMVRPLAMPGGKFDGADVVLAFMKSGDASVFGFNQHANFRAFEVTWWRPIAASVGLELLDREEEERRYPVLAVDESMWSFYALLLKADLDDTKNVYNWPVPISGSGERVRVRFELDKDPFELYRILK